jgi:hypothetical protein
MAVERAPALERLVRIAHALSLPGRPPAVLNESDPPKFGATHRLAARSGSPTVGAVNSLLNLHLIRTIADERERKSRRAGR